MKIRIMKNQFAERKGWEKKIVHHLEAFHSGSEKAVTLRDLAAILDWREKDPSYPTLRALVETLIKKQPELFFVHDERGYYQITSHEDFKHYVQQLKERAQALDETGQTIQAAWRKRTDIASLERLMGDEGFSTEKGQAAEMDEVTLDEVTTVSSEEMLPVQEAPETQHEILEIPFLQLIQNVVMDTRPKEVVYDLGDNRRALVTNRCFEAAHEWGIEDAVAILKPVKAKSSSELAFGAKGEKAHDLHEVVEIFTY